MKHSLARLSVLVSTILFSSLAVPVPAALVEIPDHTKKWQPFKNCEFVPRQYNDGDSFAVKVDNNEHVLRLAFVDAPESDVRFPDRNADQAEYFGVDPAIIPEWGKTTMAKTTELLAKPFTVTTRWASALGSSRKPRFYAVITTADGKDLGETLLSLGLARIQGKGMNPPSGETQEVYHAKRRGRAGRVVGAERPCRSREGRSSWGTSYGREPNSSATMPHPAFFGAAGSFTASYKIFRNTLDKPQKNLAVHLQEAYNRREMISKMESLSVSVQ